MMVEGWRKEKLGSLISAIGDGGTPNTNNKDYFGGDIPWVVIKDICPNICSTSTKLTEKGLNSCSAQLWPSGAIILSTGATIGEVGIAGCPLSTKQGIVGIVCNSHLHNKFLFFKLQSLKNYIKANAQGSTIREVRPNFLKSITIWIPENIAEQTKIAKILSTVDQAIEQTEAIIAKQQRIKTGLMQDLLTRGIDEHGNIRSEETHEFKDSPLGRIPVEWEVVKLGDVAQISSGLTLGKIHVGPNTLNVPYLRVANVQDGYLDLTEVKDIRVPFSYIDKYQLNIGDVLMNEGGDFDKLGRGTVWRGEIDLCLHQNHVFKVRPDKNKLLSDFLAAISSSPYGKSFFVMASKQSTNLASINSTQLKAFPIPLPSYKEQERINKLLLQQDAVTYGTEKSLRKLLHKKTALMQDLLTGKIRVTSLLEEK